MKFTFSGKELRAVVKTSLKDNCQLPYGQGPSERRGVWLVKDAGVYLMPANSEKQNPCYAEGWGEDTWLGGDDFAEFIEMPMRLIDRIMNYEKPLEVTITDTMIECSA